MQFPNAAKGVKKIYTAEILELIATIAILLTAIIGAVALASASDSVGGLVAGGIGAVIFGLGSLVLGIISFFMMLSGINAAKLDEPQFKNALIALLIGIAAQIAASAISNGLVKDICNTLSFAADMLVTYYIVLGIGSLADKLANQALSDKCKSFLKLLMAVWCVAVVLRAVGSFLSSNLTTAVIGAILGIAAAVAAVVAYVIFLGLLKQAKTMLEAA